MKPDMALGVAQTAPSISVAKPSTSTQEDKRSGSAHTNNNPANSGEPIQVDTINISPQSRQAITDAKIEEAKNQEDNKTTIKAASEATTSKVQIAYDLNGELITKYMDTSSRLVYQTPSEIMLNLKDSVFKPDSAVDTKV